MGRHKQPEIRNRILDACVDHALAHGLPDRLEPFVKASGSSTRMLIYHFGTRDALLRETLRRARHRQREFYGDLLSPKPDEPYLSTLRRTWQAMTGPEGRPYLSMFGKLREDAEQQLWPNFRREATTDWLQPLEDGMRTVGRPELATLVLAVIRGLIMDIESTGDTPRADRAFDDFLDALALLTTAGPEASVSGKPLRRDDDIPDGHDNLRILSPEQYEVLLRAREEQQEDLSPEQVDTLLKGFGEQIDNAAPECSKEQTHLP